MKHAEFNEFEKTVTLIKNIRKQTESIFKNKSIQLLSTQKRIKVSAVMLETLVHEQLDQITNIVENSPLGVVLSQQGKFIKVNNVLSEMLGYSNEEMAGMDVTHITHPSDLNQSLKYISEMDQGLRNSYSIIKTYNRKNGNSILCKTHVSVVRDVDNTIRCRIALIQMIKEL